MELRARILVIDDEEAMRDACQQALSPLGHTVRTAADGTSGLEMLKREVFDLVVLDLKLPGLSGMEVLERIREDDPHIIVIVITGYATVESAVDAMKVGAYEYIPKPFTPDALRVIVHRALEKKALTLENVLLREELKDSLGQGVIIGQSEAMKKVEELIQKVGPTDSTVLISGESGTGKELVARAIHGISARKNRPFVVVDCGGLVENLFESELFGHVRGSFTGATHTKYGRFELANGGTIFLDEIGNVGLDIQAKLLRVLQERVVTKVGGAQVVTIDVRVITATNKNLQEAVRAGTFRDDLFYRVSIVPIVLPPLRERRDDIPLLANHFLRKYNRKRKKNVKAISDKAMEALLQYDWPGNVRELENAIERAVVLAEENVIMPPDLSYYGLTMPQPSAAQAIELQRLSDVEREHIAKMLSRCGGHIGKTARVLGIDRKTLRLKMRRHGIRQDGIPERPAN